jgi:uncharacterized protein YfaS (alpha-2-macroglobulin family)
MIPLEQDSSASFAAPAQAESRKKRFFASKFIKIFFALCVAVFVIIGGYFFIWKKISRAPAVSYTQVWRLVPEKISSSAAIKVYLPRGMMPDQVKKNTLFDPQLEGHWVAESQGFFNLVGMAYGQETAKADKYQLFKPDQPLTAGLHYGVSVDLGEGKKITSDFLAVDDPRIEAIFPKGDMEAPEDSKITIAFNRPMVGLATADAMEPKNLPVEITPSPAGKWKWISTNTLQFIPETGLKLATEYTVKIKPGLTSMDGLAVKGDQAKFTTRKLRYLGDQEQSNDRVVYNQPLRIYFNQAVDLTKTIGQIKLSYMGPVGQADSGAGKNIEFVAQYKKTEKKGDNKTSTGPAKPIGIFERARAYITRLTAGFIVSLPKIGQNDDKIDKTVIEIYAAKDKFGRAKMWDAKSVYRIAIAKAFPDSGGIATDSTKQIDFQTTDLISGVSETGARSPHAGAGMFDPAGKLSVFFYEDIDLNASVVSASVPIIKKEYGKKCDDPNFSLNDYNCREIEDKRVLLVTLDKDKIGAGQAINVSLDKIVNSDKQKINPEAQKIDLRVYRPLDFGLGGADLQKIVLCSNNPLDALQTKDIKTSISANRDFEAFSWWASRKKINPDDYDSCAVGDFVTHISVGLMPQSDYHFTVNTKDVFGQTAQSAFDIRTGAMESHAVDIFPMQQLYSVTTPDKTKLVYGSKNITYAQIQICKLEALDFYREKKRLNRWSESTATPYPRGCVQAREFRVEIPERYWINNYFNINAADGFDQPLGNYIVTISHPQFMDYRKNPDHLYSFMTVTNMAAAQKTVDPSTHIDSSEITLSQDQLAGFENLYWVSDIKTLNAVSGATVTVYDKDGQKILGRGQTNDQGVARLAAVAGAGPAVVANGQDSAIVSNDDSRVNWGYPAANVKKAYMYTDRPIYRPGDTVNIKGVLRLGYDGNYQPWNSNEVVLEIKNPRRDAVWSQTLKINDFGTVQADMRLDSAAPLGTYRICVKDTYLCQNFDVKEYAPAAFKVETKAAKDEYASKEKIAIDVDAQYYFGVPVASAKAEYTISSQNYYFDRYAEGGYQFGFYDDCGGRYCYGDRFIGRGTLDLDNDGKGRINETIDLQKLAGDPGFANSRIIVFDITAKNSMGQSVSVQKSVIVHAGDIYIGAKAEPYFAAKNQDINLLAKTVDTSGEIASNTGPISAAIYRVDWIYAKRLEAGGNYNYDWEKKREAVKTVKLSGSGDYSGKVAFDKEGEYEIDLTLTAKNGNIVMTRVNLYVYGQGIASIRPYNDTTLEIKTAKTDLEAGQTGQMVIESPFSRAKALIAIERGKIFDYKIIDVIGSLYEYQFTASGDYAPNIFITVLLQSADPSVKFGYKEFTINGSRGKIDVAVTPDKKIYQPGEKVGLNIIARDGDGNPAAAELSLAVVDLSVLALVGNPKKEPAVFFYDGFPLAVSTSSNIKNILLTEKIPISKGGSGGGAESTDKVRGDFRDTALWKGSVITDSAGRARIEFDLPDNLTTWQAEAVGVTKDTKLGAGYAEFMSRKDLMMVPLKPRFIIPGDNFYIGSQVFNQSPDQKKVDVTFDSDTLKFTGKDKKLTVNLKAGESKTVYFGVAAPLDQSKGIHTFTVSAKGAPDSFQDAVRLAIPVKPNLTYEAVATFGHAKDEVVEVAYLPGNVSREQGGLTIKSSATLAVFLSNALNYLIEYPYGCTEQISSRLKAMATVIAGLKIPNLGDKLQLKKVWVDQNEYSAEELVNIGLTKIYSNQHSSGGFGMWNSEKPDFYATLEAVDMLLTVKTAGIAINEDSLRKAHVYLAGAVGQNMAKMSDDQIIAAASIVSDTKSNVIGIGVSGLADRIRQIAASDDKLQDRLSNKSLAKLAIVLAKNDMGKNFSARVNTVLDNRVVIDSRGAFVPARQSNRFYDYFETTISNTAFYLESLAVSRRDTANNDKIVRWLLNSRDKDGAWGNTQNTLSVVRAFTDYLAWKKETDADFTLTSSFNGKQITKKTFDKQTILDQSTAQVGASEFIPETNNTIEFSQKNNPLSRNNGFYYDIGLKYYLTGVTGPRDEGFAVSRAFYALDDKAGRAPLTSAKAGDVVRGHIEITIPQDRRFVAIEDYIPAGMEIVDMELATEEKSLRFNEAEVRYSVLDPDYTELRDDRAFIYSSYLEAGTYEFDYYARALAKGKYLQLPCVASEFYEPENFGRSASNYFEVK